MFQVFVTDDRYSVPTLHLVQAAGRARACELAQGIFMESPHHLRVEVFDEGSHILSLGAAGTTKAAEINRSGPGPHRPQV